MFTDIFLYYNIKEKTADKAAILPVHRSDGIRTHDPFVPNEVR